MKSTLAHKTKNAYSATRYGSKWGLCAELLLASGFSEAESEQVLRSKIMRWSADAAKTQTIEGYFLAFAAELAKNYAGIKKQAEEWVKTCNH